MAAMEAPTNDCLGAADVVGSGRAAVPRALSSALFFGLGGADDGACPTSSPTAAGGLLDGLRRVLSSADLTVTVPDHPGLGLGLGPCSVPPNAFSGRYYVDPPDPRALTDIAVAQFCATCVGVLLASVIYRSLLRGEGKRASPLRRFLVGAILLPICVLAPYALIDALSLGNAAARFAACASHVLFLFRTSEAIFGVVPEGATAGWGVYCAYFALPFDMSFETGEGGRASRPVMATRRDVAMGRANLAKALATMVALCSLLSPHDYVPFGPADAGELRDATSMSVRDCLDPRHLGNCLAVAVYFQCALALGDAVFGSLVQTLLGHRVKRSMRNPLLGATSPSDFWGRRWNVLVHSVMKRGVYRPVRGRASSAVASLAVFVASGLFHEWLVHAVCLYHRPGTSTSGVRLGSNAAFFVWNFVVIMGERMLAGTRCARTLGRAIPRSAMPFLIVTTSLPVAHWFGDPYRRGGMMADYERLLPVVRRAQGLEF